MVLMVVSSPKAVGVLLQPIISSGLSVKNINERERKLYPCGVHYKFLAQTRAFILVFWEELRKEADTRRTEIRRKKGLINP